MNNCVTVDPSHHPQSKIFSGPRVSHLPIKIINLYWGFFCVFRRHDKNKKEKGKKETSLCPASFQVMLASIKFSSVVPRVFIIRTREMWQCLHYIWHFLFSEPNVWVEEQGQQKGQTESAVSSRHARLLIFASESMPLSHSEGQGDGQELLVLSPAPPSVLVF